MSEQSKDAGLIAVLADRLVKLRIPRLLAMKEQLDTGEVLSDRDIAFLEEAFADAHGNAALIERHPEIQDVAGRLLGLYKEIMTKALESEQNKKS